MSSSLKDLIHNDDDEKTIQRLEEISWDGKSLVLGQERCGEGKEALHPLLAAVNAQSYKVLRRLVAWKGIDVNVISKISVDDEALTTALHLACERADHESIDAMLHAGADPNLALPQNNVTPLWSLTEHLQVLRAQGPIDRLRVLTLELSGQKAKLMRQNLDCRRRLLRGGANPNARIPDDQDVSLLHLDCSHFQNDHAELLVEYGARSTRTLTDMREMDLCLLCLNPQLLKLLHSQGFEYSDAETPLSILAPQLRKVAARDQAFWNKLHLTLEAYLETANDIYSYGSDGLPLLSLCAIDLQDISTQRASDLVASFVHHGVDVNHPSYFGQTPLMEASSAGNRGMLAALILHGANLEKEDNHGQTAIFNFKSLAILEDLVAAGSNLECRDEYGLTPLLNAARFCSERRIRDLLQVGANLRATDDHGWTALHWACWTGDVAVLQILLEAGASVHSRDNYGRTPSHLWGLLVEDVQSDDDEETEGVLLRAPYFVEHALEGSMAETGRVIADPKGLDLLLEHGADPVAVDREGNLSFAYLAAANQDGAHVSPLYTLVRLGAMSGLFR